MSHIAWSYSRLTDFESCPLLFCHKYVLKTIKFMSNAAMDRGKELHKQLERNTIRTVHGQPPIKGDVGHVQPIIDKFVATYPDIAVEKELAFRRDHDPCTWFDKQAWFRAKMDLVGCLNPHSTDQDQIRAVLDWKTGQFRPEEDQLKIYNLAVLFHWPLTSSVTSVLVFIDHRRSSRPLTTHRHELSSLLHEFSDRSEAIQIAKEKDEWPAKRCFKCAYCEVPVCKHASLWQRMPPPY